MNSFYITDILQSRDLQSQSNSVIGKGYYINIDSSRTNIYLKIHLDDCSIFNESLRYEILIYENIKHVKIEKPYIEPYFINMITKIITTPNKIIKNNNISPDMNKIFLYELKRKDIKKTDNIRILITEDTDSINLYDFIEELINTEWEINQTQIEEIPKLKLKFQKDILSIFRIILSSIYIMNNVLKMVHNDLHFNNILIKKEDTTYILYNGIEFKSEYKISIYDFDKSYLNNYDNPGITSEECYIGMRCNKISNMDLYYFIRVLIQIKNSIKTSQLEIIINEILQELIPKEFLDLLEISNTKSIPIYYCFYYDDKGKLIINNKNEITNEQVPCNNTTELDKSMLWLQLIPEKLEKYYNENISKIKYLKYKNKYLNIKK